jgi:hypothetical protein
MRDSFNPGVFFAEQQRAKNASDKPNNFSNLLGSKPINIKKENIKSGNRDNVDLSDLLGNGSRPINISVKQSQDNSPFAQMTNVLIEIKELIQKLIDNNLNNNGAASNQDNQSVAGIITQQIKQFQLSFDAQLNEIEFMRRDNKKMFDNVHRSLDKLYINYFEKYSKKFDYKQDIIDKKIQKLSAKYNLSVGSINSYTTPISQVLTKNMNAGPDVLNVVVMSSLYELVRHFALDVTSHNKNISQQDFTKDMSKALKIDLLPGIAASLNHFILSSTFGKLVIAPLSFAYKGIEGTVKGISALTNSISAFIKNTKTKDKLSDKYTSKKTSEEKRTDATTKLPGLLETQTSILKSMLEIQQNAFAQDNQLMQLLTGTTYDYKETQNKQERVYVEELGTFLTKAEHEDYKKKKRSAIRSDLDSGFRGKTGKLLSKIGPIGEIINSRRERETSEILNRSGLETSNAGKTKDSLSGLLNNDLRRLGKQDNSTKSINVNKFEKQNQNLLINYDLMSNAIMIGVNKSIIGVAAAKQLDCTKDSPCSSYNQFKNALNESKVGIEAQKNMEVTTHERLAARKGVLGTSPIQALQDKRPKPAQLSPIKKSEKGWLATIVDTIVNGALIVGIGSVLAPILIPAFKAIFTAIFGEKFIQGVSDYIPDFIQKMFDDEGPLDMMFNALKLGAAVVIGGPIVLSLATTFATKLVTSTVGGIFDLVVKGIGSIFAPATASAAGGTAGGAIARTGISGIIERLLPGIFQVGLPRILGGLFGFLFDGVLGGVEGYKKDGLSGILPGIFKGALTSSGIIGNAFKYGMSGLMIGGPPGMLIGIIVGSAVQLIFDNWDSIVSISGAAWDGLKDIFNKLKDFIFNGISDFVEGIGNTLYLDRMFDNDLSAKDATRMQGKKGPPTKVEEKGDQVEVWFGNDRYVMSRGEYGQVAGELDKRSKSEIAKDVLGKGGYGPDKEIPKREKGGNVAAYSPYIVGEQGPELFIPKYEGLIVPHQAMVDLPFNTKPPQVNFEAIFLNILKTFESSGTGKIEFESFLSSSRNLFIEYLTKLFSQLKKSDATTGIGKIEADLGEAGTSLIRYQLYQLTNFDDSKLSNTFERQYFVLHKKTFETLSGLVEALNQSVVDNYIPLGKSLAVSSTDQQQVIDIMTDYKNQFATKLLVVMKDRLTAITTDDIGKSLTFRTDDIVTTGLQEKAAELFKMVTSQLFDESIFDISGTWFKIKEFFGAYNATNTFDSVFYDIMGKSIPDLIHQTQVSISKAVEFNVLNVIGDQIRYIETADYIDPGTIVDFKVFGDKVKDIYKIIYDNTIDPFLKYDKKSFSAKDLKISNIYTVLKEENFFQKVVNEFSTRAIKTFKNTVDNTYQNVLFDYISKGEVNEEVKNSAVKKLSETFNEMSGNIINTILDKILYQSSFDSIVDSFKDWWNKDELGSFDSFIRANVDVKELAENVRRQSAESIISFTNFTFNSLFYKITKEQQLIVDSIVNGNDTKTSTNINLLREYITQYTTDLTNQIIEKTFVPKGMFESIGDFFSSLFTFDLNESFNSKFTEIVSKDDFIQSASSKIFEQSSYIIINQTKDIIGAGFQALVDRKTATTELQSTFSTSLLDGLDDRIEGLLDVFVSSSNDFLDKVIGKDALVYGNGTGLIGLIQKEYQSKDVAGTTAKNFDKLKAEVIDGSAENPGVTDKYINKLISLINSSIDDAFSTIDKIRATVTTQNKIYLDFKSKVETSLVSSIETVIQLLGEKLFPSGFINWFKTDELKAYINNMDLKSTSQSIVDFFKSDGENSLDKITAKYYSTLNETLKLELQNIFTVDNSSITVNNDNLNFTNNLINDILSKVIEQLKSNIDLTKEIKTVILSDKDKKQIATDFGLIVNTAGPEFVKYITENIPGALQQSLTKTPFIILEENDKLLISLRNSYTTAFLKYYEGLDISSIISSAASSNPISLEQQGSIMFSVNDTLGVLIGSLAKRTASLLKQYYEHDHKLTDLDNFEFLKNKLNSVDYQQIMGFVVDSSIFLYKSIIEDEISKNALLSSNNDETKELRAQVSSVVSTLVGKLSVSGVESLTRIKKMISSDVDAPTVNYTSTNFLPSPIITGTRKTGGDVDANKMYLAGESGPEVLISSDGKTTESISRLSLITPKQDGTIFPIIGSSESGSSIKYELKLPESVTKFGNDTMTAAKAGIDNVTTKGSEIASQIPQYFGSLTDSTLSMAGAGISGATNAANQGATWLKDKKFDVDGGRLQNFLSSGMTHTQNAINGSDVVKEANKAVEDETLDRIKNKHPMSRLFQLEDGRIFVEFTDGKQFTVSSTFMPKVFNSLKSAIADKSLSEKVQEGDDKKTQKELADKVQEKQENVASNISNSILNLGQQGMVKVGEVIKGVNDKLNSAALWTKENGLGIDGGQIATAVNRDLLTSRKEGEVSNYDRAVNAFTQAGPDRIKQLLEHKTGRSSHFDKAAVKPLEASTAMTSYGPKATANTPTTGTSDQAAQQQLANVMGISPSGTTSNQAPTGTMPTPTAPVGTKPSKVFKPGPNPKDKYANTNNPEVNKLIEERAKELISKITTTDPLLRDYQITKAWEQAAAEINSKIVNGEIKVDGVDPKTAEQSGGGGGSKEEGNASDQAARAALGGLFSEGMGKLGDIKTVNGASGTSSSVDMMGQLSSVMNQGAGSMGSIPTIGGSGGSGGMPGIPGVGIPGSNTPTGGPSGVPSNPGSNAPGSYSPPPLAGVKPVDAKDAKGKRALEAAPYLAKASEMSGVDINLLSNFTNLESGFKSNASPTKKDGTKISSAYGYGQFLDSTWAEQVQKHGSKYGVQGSGKGGAITKADAMKLRDDKFMQAAMLGEYSKQGIAMGEKYGLTNKEASVYAHHNLGPGGAKRLFEGMNKNPNAPITSVLTAKEIANNPSLYKRGMTVAQAYENLGRKVKEGQGYSDLIQSSLDPSKTNQSTAGTPGAPTAGTPGAPITGVPGADPSQQAAGYQLPTNQPAGMGQQPSNVALDKSGNLTGSNQIPEDMKSMRIKTSNGQTKTLGEMGITTFDQLQQSGGQAFSGGANDPATLMATNMVAKDLGDNFDRLTAQNDAYHQRNKPTSGHTQGNKADFTVKNMSYADAHKRTADTLSRQGLVEGKDFKIISKKHGTGDHIDFKLTDTGKNKISQNYANTQTQQGLPPGQQVSQQNQPTTGATNPANADPSKQVDPAKQADPATWKPGNQVAANTPTTGVDNSIQIDENALKQDMQNGNLPMFASAGQGVSDVTDITNSNAMVRGFDQSTSVASSTKVTSAALQPTDNEYQRNKIIAPTGVESGTPKKGDSFASQIVPDHKPSTNPTDQLISTPPKKGDSFASQIMPDTKPTGTPTNVPAQGFSSSTSVASSTKVTSAALQPTDNEYQRNKIIAPTGTPNAPVTDARTGGFYGNGTTVADHVTKPLPAPDTKPTGTPSTKQYATANDAIEAGFKEGAAETKPTGTPKRPEVLSTQEARNKIVSKLQDPNLSEDERAKWATHIPTLNTADEKTNEAKQGSNKPSGTPNAPVTTTETKVDTSVASKPVGTDVGPQIPDDVKLERDLEASVNAGPTEEDKLEKDLASAVESGKPTTGTSSNQSGGGDNRVSSGGSSNNQVSSGSGGYSQQPQMPPQMQQPQQPSDMISMMLGNLFGIGNNMMGGMMGQANNMMGQANNMMGGMGGLGNMAIGAANNVMGGLGNMARGAFGGLMGSMGGNANYSPMSDPTSGGFAGPLNNGGGLFPSQNPFSVTPPAMPTMDSTGFDSQIALNPPQTQFDIQGATASTIQNNAESQAMQTDMMGESVSSAMSASNSGGSSAQPQGDPGVASEGMLSPRHNSPQANAGASGMNKDDMGSVAVDPLGDDIANRLFSLLGPAFFAGAKNQAMEAKVNNYVENTFV